MNPSYFRIRAPVKQAITRFATWIGLPELAPPRKVLTRDAVREACDDGQWRGIALLVFERDGWTVFEDLSGDTAAYSAEQWRDLARDDELVVACYNDAIQYGQLIVIREGKIVRDFLDDRQDPSTNTNRGKLDFENASPMESWVDAATFVDTDRIAASPDEGFLWLFARSQRPM